MQWQVISSKQQSAKYTDFGETGCFSYCMEHTFYLVNILMRCSCLQDTHPGTWKTILLTGTAQHGTAAVPTSNFTALF